MDTNGVFTFIARGCNVTCQTQCSTWGDEDYEDYCTSCCQTSLCNVDSAASHHFTTWTLLPLVLVTSWLVLGTATGGDNQEAGRGSWVFVVISGNARDVSCITIFSP